LLGETRIREPLLREVNLRIHQLTRAFDGPSEYICECGHPSCQPPTPVTLPPDEFAAISTNPGHRLLAPGHQTGDDELVRQGRDCLIVRDPTQTQTLPRPSNSRPPG
jgi:hypothetical protein